MIATEFDRDTWARWYADRHLKTDSGIREVYYLPQHASEREIRFIEVNDLIADRENDALEAIDFGVDTETENAHTLLVLDITPAQWGKIEREELHRRIEHGNVGASCLAFQAGLRQAGSDRFIGLLRRLHVAQQHRNLVALLLHRQNLLRLRLDRSL